MKLMNYIFKRLITIILTVDLLRLLLTCRFNFKIIERLETILTSLLRTFIATFPVTCNCRVTDV